MKRFVSFITAIILAAVSFAAALPISALTPRDHETPEGYNDHDYQKLLAFYETADGSGVKNGDKLSPNYDPADPATWGGEPSFENYVGLTWTDGPEKRLSSFGCENGVFDLMYGELDLSGCTELTALWCGYNRISSVNVSGCTALETLSCTEDPLNDALDLSGCTALRELECSGCGLTGLPLNELPSLTLLVAGNDEIASLDLTLCPMLEEVYLHYMQPLTELVISGHPSLRVLNVELCGLTGLEAVDCPSLETLYCETGLTELTLSGCPQIRALSLGYNLLTELDVSELPLLQLLSCDGCRLTELDLTNNPELRRLDCSYTLIESLDLSNCPQLNTLLTWGAPITSIDLSGCAFLPFEGVNALGDGYVYVTKDEEETGFHVAFAQTKEGSSFTGWYDENGELITMSSFLWEEEDAPFGVVTAVFERNVVYGDANGDGIVDGADALLVLRCALELTEFSPEAVQNCDVDHNGGIDSGDALLILRYSLGLIDTL